MSRIRTNLITNRMANGAPTVSNGLVISGVTTTSEIFVGNNIKLDPISGIVTATSFVGDGSGLTGAGPSLANGANNRVVTSSSATALNGESNLIFDGTKLGIGGNPDVDFHIKSAGPTIRFTDTDTNRFSQIYAVDGNLRFDADNNNAQADTNISFRTDNSERLRITGIGSFGFGTSNPHRKVDIVGNSLVVRPTTSLAGTSGDANAVNNSIIARMPYGQNAGSTNNAGARIGIQFTGATDSDSNSWGYVNDPQKSASIYGVSEDTTAGYSRKMGLAFYTSPYDSAQVERLRIHSDGRIQPKYSSSAGATGGIIMVGGFYAKGSAHHAEGIVQAKTNTNANCFDAAGWYNNSTYRYTPQVKGHYQFHGTGMMFTGMNGSSVEQSIYFVKNGSAGGGIPQYASGYSTNYGNYDLHHISNVIYMNGTTDYLHFHLSSNQSVQIHQESCWSGFLLYPAA